MRVVLGEITNTVPAREKVTGSAKGYAPPQLPEEADLLLDCCRQLHHAWGQCRARGGNAYLLRHFAQLAWLHPATEPPHRELLEDAWFDEESGGEEDQETSPPKLWTAPAPFSRCPAESFEIFEESPDPEGLEVGRERAHGEEPEQEVGVEEMFFAPESSDEDEDDDASEGLARLPSWRQKELCEEEMEQRLLSLLEQEQQDDWLLEQETQAALELAQSLNAGADSDVSTPTGTAWAFRTPPRRRQPACGAEGSGGSAPPRCPRAPRVEEEERTADVGCHYVGTTRGLQQRLHTAAERHRPCAEDILTRMGAEERVLAVDWLLESCRAMHFQEAVAFSAVACLDRYVASLRSLVPVEEMQGLVLSTVSIALKLHGMSEVSANLREVLSHLSQQAVPVRTVLIQERKVLLALDFEVSTPTAVEILGLLSSHSQTRAAKDQRCEFCSACRDPFVWRLAEFLLHMVLREVDLLYAYPCSILASAAALLAWTQADVRPCRAQLRVLLRGIKPSIESSPRIQPAADVCAPKSRASSCAEPGRMYHCI